MSGAGEHLPDYAQDVWMDYPLPGGYVCAACLMPTESEPCAEHQQEANHA